MRNRMIVPFILLLFLFNFFIIVLATAWGDSREILEPPFYSVQKAQGQWPVAIDKKYFKCGGRIDFLFSELPEKTSVPSESAKLATKEHPDIKTALSQKIRTERKYSDNIYSNWKQYTIWGLWIITFLYLLPGGGLLTIKHNPKDITVYVPPIILIGLAISVSLLLNSYNYVNFDNAGDTLCILEINDKTLTVPPRSNIEVYMNSGHSRIKTIDPKTNTVVDDCIISVPSRAGTLIYNIKNLNEYTLEYGAYIYPK